MVGIRNRISSLRAGGPRQHSHLRDRFMLLIDPEKRGDLVSEFDSINLRAKELDNSPVMILSPFTDLGDVLEGVKRRISENNTVVDQAISEVGDIGNGQILEASRATIKSTSALLRVISQPDGVKMAGFVTTSADFGPENLRVSPNSMETLSKDEYHSKDRTLDDLNSQLGMSKAWEETRGEGVAIPVFDTGYAEDLFDSSRVVGEWHGEDVDSVYASEEGHGSMCAGAAAANKEEGVPYNGIAPEADVILVRITDNEGQIRGDYVAEAWDWVTDFDYDGPMVSNHSYGVPVCTGRPRGSTCNDTLSQVIQIANSKRDMVSVYAAGNEAGYCGRRPSGITNGITGHNSLNSVVTVGALRFDMRDCQEYSSHGRGDCAPVADPKPNVSCALPSHVYYGDEDGWVVKDMSKGLGGSSGGTSHASPSVAGKIALLQSKSMDVNGQPLTTEQVKEIIQENAERPRRTQASIARNLIGGDNYDARFGHGQINIVSALEDV